MKKKTLPLPVQKPDTKGHPLVSGHRRSLAIELVSQSRFHGALPFVVIEEPFGSIWDTAKPYQIYVAFTFRRLWAGVLVASRDISLFEFRDFEVHQTGVDGYGKRIREELRRFGRTS